MPTTITYNKRIKEKLESAGFELTLLTKDLNQYFSTKYTNNRIKADYLGKDVQFYRPDSIFDAQVHHIHVFVDGISCSDRWLNQAEPTSDSYIVYTYGDLDTNAYLVLDFIDNDAHVKCRDRTLMTGYKIEAEDFRNKF